MKLDYRGAVSFNLNVSMIGRINDSLVTCLGRGSDYQRSMRKH